LVESFYRSFDLPVTTLRPFNTYGPRQSARAVIPTIITQALSQDHVHLGNLAASRDLGYIADTVRAFLLAGSAPGIDGETIHLGTGREVTVSQLAEIILHKVAEKTGRKAGIEVEPQRLRPPRSEVQRLLADSSLARQKLGWEPEVSLEDGLDRTIDWIASNINLYRPEQYQR
jgi:dTDP-glucose 4,6-dehydratase